MKWDSFASQPCLYMLVCVLSSMAERPVGAISMDTPCRGTSRLWPGLKVWLWPYFSLELSNFSSSGGCLGSSCTGWGELSLSSWHLRKPPCAAWGTTHFPWLTVCSPALSCPLSSPSAVPCWKPVCWSCFPPACSKCWACALKRQEAGLSAFLMAGN